MHVKKQVDINNIGTPCQVTDFGLWLIRDDRENNFNCFCLLFEQHKHGS